MKIFVIKDVKKLMIAVIIILLCCIAAGQAAVVMLANDYKKEMIAHDDAVAGYLAKNYLKNDLGKSQIATAFTEEKTNEDVAEGQALLQAAGYDAGTNNTLLPEVQSFHLKYAVLALVFSVVFSLAIIALLLIFFNRLDRKLEKANTDLSNFMAGNHNIRLNDSEEGSVSKLFSSINAMATSLTAHVTKESQNKEFLKDTISDISHQLKTPLAALQMYNEIILDEKNENEVVTNFLLKSKNELRRIEDLIQNLLKLAKLDAGTIVLERKNHNLKDFLKNNLDGLRTRAEIENKSLTLACEEQIILNFDEGWLWQAVSNIIKNALDHTSRLNMITVEVTQTPLVTTITIKDNGAGIHPEDIHYVFKRFYRSRFSMDKQGIGIGLTLSKSIVEKHGGSIIVESELGKGTTFYLSFPKLTIL